MLTLQTLTLDDLPLMLDLEQEWPPEERASADQFRSRLERFAEGCLMGWEDGQAVAMITACPVCFDPDSSGFPTWDAATCHGRFPDPREYGKANGLYYASGIIRPSHRTLRNLRSMLLAAEDVARARGWEWALAGPALQGYDAWCRAHGETPVESYVFTRRGQRLVDPLLEVYRGLGYAVPDARFVKPGYFPNDASRSCAAIVVKALHPDPKEAATSGRP